MRYHLILMMILEVCMMVTFSVQAGSLYSKRLCQLSGFDCIKIKHGQSWSSLWHNAKERDIVMRINRMNIALYPGAIIAVPKQLAGRDIMDFSPFHQKVPSRKEKLLAFDPAINAFAAYDADGTLVYWGPASGGAHWCPDLHRSCLTTPGHFRIFSVGKPSCVSRKFPLPRGGAPMPYCMYFNHGQAFHGSAHGLPGYNASHSCVRLYVEDAKWLNQNFVSAPNERNHYRGTVVIVGPYAD